MLLPTASLCKISLLPSHVPFAVAPEIKAITNKDDDNKFTGTEGMPGKTDLVLSYKTISFVALLEKNRSSKHKDEGKKKKHRNACFRNTSLAVLCIKH